MSIELPRSRHAVLCDRASALLASRRPGTDLKLLARDVLVSIHDTLVYAGRDDLFAALGAAYPGVDLAERQALAEHEPALAAAVKRLGAIEIDGGGPRNAKPAQVVDSVLGALDVTVVDDVDDAVEVSGEIRAKVEAAIANTLGAALAPAAIRDVVIAEARALTDEPLFEKITKHLDAKGMTIEKNAKVPLDVLQTVQRAVTAARTAIVARTASTAIDRVKELVETVSPEAAARIDQPITQRSTPREVVLLRLTDPRLDKTPTAAIHAVIDGLTELVRIRWKAAEQVAITYGASKTFKVGDVIDHPKFGRGTVTVVNNQRIDVEFEGSKNTLVHTPKR